MLPRHWPKNKNACQIRVQTRVLSRQGEDPALLCSASMVDQLPAEDQPRRHALEEVGHKDNCSAHTHTHTDVDFYTNTNQVSLAV